MAVNFNLLAREGPANLYEGFMAGQQAAAQNTLAQQKMAQEQEMNALRRQQAQLGMQQARTEMAGAEEDRARKRRAERVGLFRERLLRAATPEAAREIVKMQYADPDLAPVLSQAGTLDQALAEVPDDPVQFQTYRQQEAMGMSEWMKSQLPKTVGNAIYLPSEGRFVTPPAAPKEPTKPGDIALLESLGLEPTLENLQKLKQAQAAPSQPRAPVAVLQNGRPVYVSPEQAVGQTPFTPASVQVLGMGPGREPPAPTITQIQDPTDPTRMITIDARRYQGGGVGTPGVIGASGKTPAATAAAMKKEEGATQAKDILDTLRTAYDTLDQARAVPSQQRNALSNALSYVAGTGVGQVAGRVVGTEAQTQRDIIQSARNQMLNAIKNATGMSAQQLNSNVEFRSWLEALTDPTRSIEANRAILDNMEKFIASGGKYSAKGGSQAAPAAAPAGGATGGWSVVR